MICPKLSGLVVLQGAKVEEHKVELHAVECAKEKCAWWVAEKEACVVMCTKREDDN